MKILGISAFYHDSPNFLFPFKNGSLDSPNFYFVEIDKCWDSAA